MFQFPLGPSVMTAWGGQKRSHVREEQTGPGWGGLNPGQKVQNQDKIVKNRANSRLEK